MDLVCIVVHLYNGDKMSVDMRGRNGVKIRLPKKEIGEFVNSLKKSTGSNPITEIPKITDPAIEILEFKPIRPPYSYARILYNNRSKDFLYEAIEPHLNDEEQEFYNFIEESLKKTLTYDVDHLKYQDKEEYLKGNVESFLQSRATKITPILREKLIYYVLRDYIGYGPIDVLIRDEEVEDISCDGVGINVYIFHQKYESIRSNVIINSDEKINSFVISLSQRSGKQASVANPIVDGTTTEGHRLQATYAREISTRGGSFTIRRFKERPFTPVDIIISKTASVDMMVYMWVAAENGESLIICGGPGAGKTSTLNAVALFIPPTSKIVSMEDTREINLPHENWIPGATRSGTGERGIDGRAPGEIDMFDLVRAALRQRPNFIIVGEVRGKETYTMFQAMATGHTTYSTMHADSVKSMVNRLENPPINTPRILLSALNNVIIQHQVRVGMNVVRRIKQIVEIVGFEPETNELITNTVFEWDSNNDTFIYRGHSFLYDKVMEMKNLTHEEMEEEVNRRVEVLNYLVSRKVVDFKKFAQIIISYYKEPHETIEKIRGGKFA
jgi:flagellar protein FlaI